MFAFAVMALPQTLVSAQIVAGGKKEKRQCIALSVWMKLDSPPMYSDCT